MVAGVTIVSDTHRVDVGDLPGKALPTEADSCAQHDADRSCLERVQQLAFVGEAHAGAQQQDLHVGRHWLDEGCKECSQPGCGEAKEHLRNRKEETRQGVINGPSNWCKPHGHMLQGRGGVAFIMLHPDA